MKIDKRNLKLVVNSESLDWERDVQNCYDGIKSDIEYELENGDEDFGGGSREAIIKFLDYELTNDDKVEILENIMNDYEYELRHADYNISIYDEDGIRHGINMWIYNNFDVNPEDLGLAI